MDLSLLPQFGAELRQAREASGRSVDEIAKQTRIHRRYIEAIESGDASALPPGPYVPAFLREFARAVGLKVPQEFAITSSINHGLTTTTIQSAPIVKNQHASNPLGVVSKVADETTKVVGNVAKTAVKTTGTVIKGVGEGVNDAVGVFTSRSLREEAELVRRERLGLAKFPEEIEAATASPEAEATAADPASDERLVNELPDAGVKAKSVKAPIIPIAISAEDPVAGEATLRLGKSQKKFPVTNVVIIALLLLFATVAYFAITDMKEQTRGDSVQADLSGEDLPETAEPSTETESPAAAAAPAMTAPIPAKDDSLRFVLKATDPVWVSIGPDDAAPFRGELKPGETKTFVAADRFSVNIGNQKALEMTFNGTRLSNLPTIKNSGMVVRNLILTRDRVSLDGAEVSTGAQQSSGEINATAKPVASKPSGAVSSTKKAASTTKKSSRPTIPKRTTTIAPVEPKPASAD